jgi:hypothetical protein
MSLLISVSITTEIKSRKKNIRTFVTFFCILVMVSTMCDTFGIGNSLAQQQTLQTQLPSMISYKSPWNSKVQISISQPLCQAGICNQSSGPINSNTTTSQPAKTTSSSTQAKSANSTTTSQPAKTTSSSTQAKSPTTVSITKTFTNTKNLNLKHFFVSNKVIGPDRFRFITSYWTTSDTSRYIDTGTSSNESRFGGIQTGISVPNQKLEVDVGEGFATLAVVLQYEGVVHLAGITAALKLPPGITAQLPLTDDLNNYNIALSSYRGHIWPSEGIVLYFSLYVSTNAKVQVPAPGLLALHFLRFNQRSILDSLDAPEQNLFTRALTIKNGNNSTTFNSNLGTTSSPLSRDYFSQFGRFIPFDFIAQVTPVLLKVTGREILDVGLAGGSIGAPLDTLQSNILNGIIPSSTNSSNHTITTVTTISNITNPTTTSNNTSTAPPSTTNTTAVPLPNGNGTASPSTQPASVYVLPKSLYAEVYSIPKDKDHAQISTIEPVASVTKPDPPSKSSPPSSTSNSGAKSSPTSPSSSSNAGGTKQVITTSSKAPPTGRLIINPVEVVLTNRGDVPIHDLVVTFSTNVTSLVGVALAATTYPLGIIGQTTYHIFTLPPYSSQTATLLIRSAVFCSALAPLSAVSTYTNAVGITQTQTNTVTLEVGSGICPSQQLPGGVGPNLAGQ